MAYKKCVKYTDEFWGQKIKDEDCELILEESDEETFIDATIELILEDLPSVESLKNEIVELDVRVGKDDWDLISLEIDLTPYLCLAMKEIMENWNCYSNDNWEEFMEWKQEAINRYKEYLKECNYE